MKKTKIIGIALSALILGSCATSSDVVDGGLFQKRKYNKGWNINKKSKVEISPVDANDLELAVTSTNEKNTDSETEVKGNEDVAIIGLTSSSNVNNEASNATFEKEVELDVVAPVEKSIASSIVRSKKVRPSSFYQKRTSERKDRSFTLNLSDNTSDSNETTDAALILLVILAFLIPPLAVGLYEGITARFWISLLLTFLFVLPGVIYALLIVIGAI